MDDKFRDLRLAARQAALHGCSMFSDLPSADLARVAEFVEERSAPRAQELFREGDPARGFFVVRKGAISVYRLSADGTETVIHVFRAGQSFAEGALAAAGGYPASARVVEDCELLFVPREEFLALIRSHADIALRMIASMSQHLRLLVNTLEDLQGKDVETRLAHWLLKRCPTPRPAAPVDIVLGVTKSALAAELSTRNETLSRALARLRDAGEITVEGKMIRVLTPAQLDARLRRALGE